MAPLKRFSPAFVKRSMRAAGILGLLVHSFGARAQEPVKNLGAKPPAIGSAMQTGKPLAFEASESGLKLWVKGQKDKGYAFVTQSQYPSLFRIASGNINPFVESREGFTFNGKALSGTLKFQQRWEQSGFPYVGSREGPYTRAKFNATTLSLDHKRGSLFVTSIPGAGKLIGVYGGHDPYVDIGQFIPNSGKSTYYLRVQPSSKNDFSFVINGIGEGSKPSYGLELRKKF